MRFSLSSFLFSLCLFTSLQAAGQSLEYKAGLMPLTFYAKGAIRIYYNPDASIQGIS
jgi:hypothetical protein